MTTDHDLKALIRARMAKTGESYTTARQQLLGRESDAEQAPLPPTSLTDGHDDSRVDRDRVSVDITDEDVIFQLGQPAATFKINIPRRNIVSVEALVAATSSAASGPASSRTTRTEVFGSRGRWSVRTSSDGLIRLRLTPAVRADVTLASALKAEIDGSRAPRMIRWLARDRKPLIRDLTISVDDQIGLLATLLPDLESSRKR